MDQFDLKLACEELQLTVPAMARQMGRDETTIRRWLKRGEQNPIRILRLVGDLTGHTREEVLRLGLGRPTP